MKLADLDILIVDDHEAMRTLLLKVLNRAGVAKLRAAASAIEGLAALAQRPADLVLADQMMPEMDGLAFVRALRSDAAIAGARVIMISGRAEAAHAEAARAAGADAVLVKPVSPRDLLAAIESVMPA